jgi:hypothetical protein
MIPEQGSIALGVAVLLSLCFMRLRVDTIALELQ